MQPQDFINRIRTVIDEIVIGQRKMIDSLLIGLLSDGHILLEGVPGLAKTLTVKTLAQGISADFRRIQFTPDLLPADVTGTRIFNQQTNQFEVRRGPVFANFVLADEINRAPAKVQSALLEAMEEKQITIGENTYALPKLFLVLATQNPLEQEGTYPLPEAQLDRFMLKLFIDYPTEEEEQLIIRNKIKAEDLPLIERVATIEEIIEARHSVRQVFVDEEIEKYIIRIVFATRNPEKYGLKEIKSLVSYGGSPRASIYLAMAAKAKAFMDYRDKVLPEDIKAVCKDVLRHRIGLTYEAQAEKISTVQIIDTILNKVSTP